MSRMYPCAECAADFAKFVRIDPPPTGSRHELEQWMCTLHNRVNRKLDKPAFSCDFVRSRWQPLDCEEPAGCRLAGV